MGGGESVIGALTVAVWHKMKGVTRVTVQNSTTSYKTIDRAIRLCHTHKMQSPKKAEGATVAKKRARHPGTLHGVLGYNGFIEHVIVLDDPTTDEASAIATEPAEKRAANSTDTCASSSPPSVARNPVDSARAEDHVPDGLAFRKLLGDIKLLQKAPDFTFVKEKPPLFDMPYRGITGVSAWAVETRLFDGKDGHHWNNLAHEVFTTGYTGLTDWFFWQLESALTASNEGRSPDMEFVRRNVTRYYLSDICRSCVKKAMEQALVADPHIPERIHPGTLMRYFQDVCMRGDRECVQWFYENVMTRPVIRQGIASRGYYKFSVKSPETLAYLKETVRGIVVMHDPTL